MKASETCVLYAFIGRRYIVENYNEDVETVDYQSIRDEFARKFGVDISNGCDVTVKGTFNIETGIFTITSVDGQEARE